MESSELPTSLAWGEASRPSCSPGTRCHCASYVPAVDHMCARWSALFLPSAQQRLLSSPGSWSPDNPSSSQALQPSCPKAERMRSSRAPTRVSRSQATPQVAQWSLLVCQ